MRLKIDPDAFGGNPHLRARLEIERDDFRYGGGLEIAIKGFRGNPNDAEPQTQIYITRHNWNHETNRYEDRLEIHVWTGETEDPTQSFVLAPYEGGDTKND